MKTITIGEAKDKLKLMGVINIKTNKVISFAGFKKLVDVHDYGNGRNPFRIIILRNSRENIFGFYPMQDTMAKNLTESYEMLCSLVNTVDSSNDFDLSMLDDDIQFGNCGIPISYGNLRFIEPIQIS